MDRDALVAELLVELSASRVTIRLDVPGANFPVAAEAVADGVSPIAPDASVDQRAAPTARWLMEHRTTLVQGDCVNAEVPPPAELLAVYGVKAQLLEPLLATTGVRGWISVHDVTGTREWTPEEINTLRRAGRALEATIGDGP